MHITMVVHQHNIMRGTYPNQSAPDQNKEFKIFACGRHSWWARKGIISPSNICSLPSSLRLQSIPICCPAGRVGPGAAGRKLNKRAGRPFFFLQPAEIKAGKKAEWSSPRRDLGVLFFALSAGSTSFGRGTGG